MNVVVLEYLKLNYVVIKKIDGLNHNFFIKMNSITISNTRFQYIENFTIPKEFLIYFYESKFTLPRLIFEDIETFEYTFEKRIALKFRNQFNELYQKQDYKTRLISDLIKDSSKSDLELFDIQDPILKDIEIGLRYYLKPKRSKADFVKSIDTYLKDSHLPFYHFLLNEKKITIGDNCSNLIYKDVIELYEKKDYKNLFNEVYNSYYTNDKDIRYKYLNEGSFRKLSESIEAKIMFYYFMLNHRYSANKSFNLDILKLIPDEILNLIYTDNLETFKNKINDVEKKQLIEKIAIELHNWTLEDIRQLMEKF